jgi:hypothetical protein
MDESGEPRPGVMHARSRWFVLTAVAMSDDQQRRYQQEVDVLKARYWSRRLLRDRPVTLHDVDIRNGNGSFNFLGDRAKQAAFRADITRVIERVDFTAFAAGIRTDAVLQLLSGYVADTIPIHQFGLAFNLLLERLIDFLYAASPPLSGALHMESSSAGNDGRLQQVLNDARQFGTQWVEADAVQTAFLPGITFHGKHGTHPIELSDLLAGEVARWMQSGCMRSSRLWQVFSQKFYARDDLSRGKFGLKIFPDSDSPTLRERIEAHRDWVWEGMQN